MAAKWLYYMVTLAPPCRHVKQYNRLRDIPKGKGAKPRYSVDSRKPVLTIDLFVTGR